MITPNKKISHIGDHQISDIHELNSVADYNRFTSYTLIERRHELSWLQYMSRAIYVMPNSNIETILSIIPATLLLVFMSRAVRE